MYKFILGKKVGMTQIYKDNKVVPVSVIEVGPCVVTNIKNSERYSSVQLGFDEMKKIKKPIYGQARNLGNFNVIKEFRLPENVNYLNVGSSIKADIFNEGDFVNVSGTNKGKGFQGVIKRYNFSTLPRTHGHPHQRQPGSIGGMTPQRVVKGKKMGGRMGNERITVKNLQVVDVDLQNNLISVKGGIPGRKGTVLEVREARLTKLGRIRKFPKRKK